MREVILGLKPEDIMVILPRNADFVCSIHSEEENFPVGSSIKLAIGSSEWTAEINGQDAVFSISAQQVDEMILENPKTARLYYMESTGSRMLWGEGDVRII